MWKAGFSMGVVWDLRSKKTKPQKKFYGPNVGENPINYIWRKYVEHHISNKLETCNLFKVFMTNFR